MATMGERLRSVRERRGWSQIDVADKTGLSNFAISNYERGTREPDIETLLKFVDLYSVSLEWLVTGRESKKLDWHDFEEELLKDGVRWSYEGAELTPEIRRKFIDIAKFLIAEEKKNKPE